MKIRTVIVDDEPLAREGIRLRLADEPDIVVVGEYDSAEQAAKALDRDRPDLLFLDIEMPGESGSEMLRRLGPERVPAVVLVTAHDEHALDAFEVSVVDYLLKPIVEARFHLALSRVRRRLEEHRALGVRERLRELVGQFEEARLPSFQGGGLEPTEPAKNLTRFLVRTGGREHPVPIGAVDWIEAAGDYARLHCSGNTYLVRQTLTALDQGLDPRVFGRIHRSALVRFDRVASLVAEGHGDWEVRLIDGTRLRLSRTHRDAFRQALAHAGITTESQHPERP